MDRGYDQTDVFCQQCADRTNCTTLDSTRCHHGRVAIARHGYIDGFATRATTGTVKITVQVEGKVEEPDGDETLVTPASYMHFIVTKSEAERLRFGQRVKITMTPDEEEAEVEGREPSCEDINEARNYTEYDTFDESRLPEE